MKMMKGQAKPVSGFQLSVSGNGEPGTGNRKGQAAMEYLMTYGWAILAIVLVIAALIFLNPFRAPEVCLFEQAGFTCNEPPPQLYVTGQSNDLRMNVKVWNQVGQPIIVRYALCTNAPGAELPDVREQVANDQVPSGDSLTLTGLNCYNAQGDRISSQPGQEFRGKLVIWYNYENDIDPNVQHQIKANVISKVTQQAQ
ncbi:MAG: hypothetical protein AB1657_03455 [Candidatus Micrarchaeota archaeon]